MLTHERAQQIQDRAHQWDEREQVAGGYPEFVQPLQGCWRFNLLIVMSAAHDMCVTPAELLEWLEGTARQLEELMDSGRWN